MCLKMIHNLHVYMYICMYIYKHVTLHMYIFGIYLLIYDTLLVINSEPSITFLVVSCMHSQCWPCTSRRSALSPLLQAAGFPFQQGRSAC